MIEAARFGDEEAVRRILENYGRRIRSSVGRRMAPALRARADSEDVLQSAMVSALAHLAEFEFRGEEAFVAWLTAIAVQEVNRLSRHHGAQCRDLAREQPISQVPPVHADQTSVTQAAARKEQHMKLRQAIAKLPAPDRDVVRLRTLEGFAFKVVAERLGLADEHAARYVYRRALKGLGRLLAGSPAEELQ